MLMSKSDNFSKKTNLENSIEESEREKNCRGVYKYVLLIDGTEVRKGKIIRLFSEINYGVKWFSKVCTEVILELLDNPSAVESEDSFYTMFKKELKSSYGFLSVEHPKQYVEGGKDFTCYVIQEPINSENKPIIEHLLSHKKYSDDEIDTFVEEAKTNLNLTGEDSKKDLTKIINYMSENWDFTKTIYIGCVDISSKFKFLRQMFSWE